VCLVRLRPVWVTNHPPLVLWHCWLGHQTCKNRRPYNLYCVGADVKPCSINLFTDNYRHISQKNKAFPLVKCIPRYVTILVLVWRKSMDGRIDGRTDGVQRLMRPLMEGADSRLRSAAHGHYYTSRSHGAPSLHKCQRLQTYGHSDKTLTHFIIWRQTLKNIISLFSFVNVIVYSMFQTFHCVHFITVRRH